MFFGHPLLVTEQKNDFGSNHKTLQKINTKSNDFGVEIAIIFGDDVGTPNFEIFGSFLASISEPSWCQVGAKLARSRPKLGLEAS